MLGLHPKQSALMDYWRDQTRKRGMPPTIKAAQRDLGIASPSTVVYHLEKLTAKGLLEHFPNEYLSYRLPLVAHENAQDERKGHE